MNHFLVNSSQKVVVNIEIERCAENFLYKYECNKAGYLWRNDPLTTMGPLLEARLELSLVNEYLVNAG